MMANTERYIDILINGRKKFTFLFLMTNKKYGVYKIMKFSGKS